MSMFAVELLVGIAAVAQVVTSEAGCCDAVCADYGALLTSLLELWRW
jgi:hypothetical protein